LTIIALPQRVSARRALLVRCRTGLLSASPEQVTQFFVCIISSTSCGRRPGFHRLRRVADVCHLVYGCRLAEGEQTGQSVVSSTRDNAANRVDVVLLIAPLALLNNYVT
jgi:hypothetical protein